MKAKFIWQGAQTISMIDASALWCLGMGETVGQSPGRPLYFDFFGRRRNIGDALEAHGSEAPFPLSALEGRLWWRRTEKLKSCKAARADETPDEKLKS